MKLKVPCYVKVWKGDNLDMFCTNCGKELRNGAKYCTVCGAPVEDKLPVVVPNPASDKQPVVMSNPAIDRVPVVGAVPEADKVVHEEGEYYPDPCLPEGMLRDNDGNIRWEYHLDMIRNPYILSMLTKLMFFGTFIFGLIFAVAFGSDAGSFGDAVVLFFAIFLGFGAGISLLIAIVYFIMLGIGGSFYTVEYLMTQEYINFLLVGSDKGEKHRKRVHEWLTIVYLLSRGHSDALVDFEPNKHMISEYKDVRKVTPDREHNLIKLKHRVFTNRIYVAPHQYDFVLNYLTTHCQ